jgi:hypothetical protein
MNDVDFSPVDMMRWGADINYRRFSQELRINSLNDKNDINWLAGIYFFDQRKDMDVIFVIPSMRQTYLSVFIDHASVFRCRDTGYRHRWTGCATFL